MKDIQVSNNSITIEAPIQSMIEESDSEHPESESHQKLALDYSAKMDNRSRRKRYSERIKAQKSFFLAALFLISMAAAPILVSMNADTPFSPTARGPDWGCMDDGTYFWETNESSSIGKYKSGNITRTGVPYQGNMHAPYPDIFYSETDDFFVWEVYTDYDSIGGRPLTLIEMTDYEWPEDTHVYITNDRFNEREFSKFAYHDVKNVKIFLDDEYSVTHIIFSNSTVHSGELRNDDFIGYNTIITAYCDGVILGYQLRFGNSILYYGAPRPVTEQVISDH